MFKPTLILGIKDIIADLSEYFMFSSTNLNISSGSPFKLAFFNFNIYVDVSNPATSYLSKASLSQLKQYPA
jgi:hypothetical protein